MQDPQAACAELQRAVDELGLWGACVGTEFAGLSLHDAAFDALYEQFVRLDVPLFIHPAPAGIDGPAGDPHLKQFDLDLIAGFAAQETIAVAQLFFGGVLQRHPALDICISHGGGSIALLAGRMQQAGMKRPWAPDWVRGPDALDRFLRKLWYDTHLPDQRSLAVLAGLVGSARLVFGTNFAGWDQPEHPEQPDSAALYADNARRLLRRGLRADILPRLQPT
jgi:aminocarboxymuconate-semialdehyde decarboxylase